MGYFNYFIKCIIRNVAYKLCKPKVFFTVLLSVIILFALKHFGYCSDLQLDTIIEQLEQITENQSITAEELGNQLLNISNNTNASATTLGYLNNQLDYIRKTQLPAINSSIESLRTQNHADLAAISSQLLQINNMLTTVNSSINSIISTINTNHNELLNELDINNQAVINELNKIQDILTGNQKIENQNYQEISGIRIETNGSFSSSVNETVLYFPYEQGSNYNITITNNYAPDVSFTYIISGGNNIPSAGGSSTVISQAPLLGGSSLVYSLPTSYNFKYIYIRKWPDVSVNIEKITGQTGLNNIDNSINQGNQLQQEQNDFLKQETSDSDVSVDSFNSVDANDITSEGLTGVFTNIYNSINSWSSKDINLPIPYTNKSIVIPANYTHNMLSSFGGSWIITFISSIYYFIVARFIIYSITSIINSIKSGSILETDSKNNITTDML